MPRHLSPLSCLLLLSIVVPAFSGCATIMSERKYEVTMDNKGGPTYFSVQDHKNRTVHSGITPTQVTLPAKTKWLMPAKYNVAYAGRDGVQQQQLKASLDWWTAGNIILGGVPGMAVDAATGAIWKLDEQVVGQVSAQNVVANEHEGGVVLASFQSDSQGSPNATTQAPAPQIQHASFGQEVARP